MPGKRTYDTIIDLGSSSAPSAVRTKTRHEHDTVVDLVSSSEPSAVNTACTAPSILVPGMRSALSLGIVAGGSHQNSTYTSSPWYQNAPLGLMENIDVTPFTAISIHDLHTSISNRRGPLGPQTALLFNWGTRCVGCKSSFHDTMADGMQEDEQTSNMGSVIAVNMATGALSHADGSCYWLANIAKGVPAVSGKWISVASATMFCDDRNCVIPLVDGQVLAITRNGLKHVYKGPNGARTCSLENAMVWNNPTN